MEGDGAGGSRRSIAGQARAWRSAGHRCQMRGFKGRGAAPAVRPARLSGPRFRARPRLAPMTSPRDPSRTRHLGGELRRTHAALFRHPAPADLTWGEVIALLERLAEVREDRKGRFKVTRNGVLLTLRAPLLRIAMTGDELALVRRFLERSEEGRIAPVVAAGTFVVVAVDDAGARLYRLLLEDGEPAALEPFEANGYAAHLRTTLAPTPRPEPRRHGFVRDLVRALRGVDEFVLVAGGAGAEGELAALRTELRRADAKIHGALAASLVLKGTRATEAALLERVRAFLAAR